MFALMHETSSAQVPTKVLPLTVPGVPLGTPAKIEAHVDPVPGETNHEDTLDTFLAIFGE